MGFLKETYQKWFHHEINSFYLALTTVLTFLFAPQGNLYEPTIGIFLLMGIDILTRLYANCTKAGGVIKAIKYRVTNSETFYYRLVRKLIRNGFLMIIAGWSYVYVPIEFTGLTVYAFLYGFMFLGEAISILENLVEAGHKDLQCLVNRFKKVKNLYDGKEKK